MHEEEKVFVALLHDYKRFAFPFYPIITAREAQEIILSMRHDREAEAFVYALSAVTISLAHSFSTPETDEASVFLGWLFKALAVLPGVISIDNITVRRIVLVEFIHTSLAGLGRFEPAHHHLRQSAPMVEALRLGHADSSEHLAYPERARRQRLYYLIFIHKSCFTLFHHHRVSMTAMEWLPGMDDKIPIQVCQGFNQIISLFCHIDMIIINAWLDVSDEKAAIDPSWVQDKHSQLEAEPAGSAEHIAVSFGSDEQFTVLAKSFR